MYTFSDCFQIHYVLSVLFYFTTVIIQELRYNCNVLRNCDHNLVKKGQMVTKAL